MRPQTGSSTLRLSTGSRSTCCCRNRSGIKSRADEAGPSDRELAALSPHFSRFCRPKRANTAIAGSFVAAYRPIERQGVTEQFAVCDVPAGTCAGDPAYGEKYATLLDDPMYAFHREGRHLEASSWSILSPDVPIFRDDVGMELDQPWLLSFITCAAPYAPELGQPLSSQLLRERIHRVLEIAHSYGYRSLVLGAWGCGAFGNDATRTAEDFRAALEHDFAGVFTDVVFAITDWSPERRFLGPFRSVFEAS